MALGRVISSLTDFLRGTPAAGHMPAYGASGWSSRYGPLFDLRDWADDATLAVNATSYANTAVGVAAGIGGGIVYLPKLAAGSYVVKRQTLGSQTGGGINLRKNVSLWSNGATLDLQDNCDIIKVKGTVGLTATITADIAVNATTVTLASTTGLVVGDDVMLRLNTNLSNTNEPQYILFAKITIINAGTGVVTLDRPIAVAMTVATEQTNESTYSLTTGRNRSLLQITELMENISIRGLVLSSAASGGANAESGIGIVYGRNVSVRDVIGTNVGAGLVLGQFVEGLRLDNLRVPACAAQSSASKGRGVALSNCHNVAADTITVENFEGEAIQTESYCRKVQFRNVRLVDNNASRSRTSRYMIVSGDNSDLSIDGLEIEGVGGGLLWTDTAGAAGGTIRVANPSIRLAAAAKASGRLTRVSGDLRIGATLYREARKVSVRFRITASASALTVATLPTGLYRSLKVNVSSTTGITFMFLIGATANLGSFHAQLSSGTTVEISNSTQFGTDATWNDGGAHTLQLYSDGTVPAGAWGTVEADYMPVAVDDATKALTQSYGNVGAYTTSNIVATRTVNTSTATTADLANALGTLVADLKSAGVIG